MTYNELMQKPGKRINPKVYYYQGNNKVEILHDNIKLSKPFFNASLIGTIMKGLELELTVELPKTPIYFENTVRYGTNSATKTIGPYFLKEKPEFNADSKTYTHKLYDNFITAMVDYKPITITYPCTVLDFFKKLCLECNFTTNITSLPNGNRILNYDIYDNIGFTYRDVFQDIGQATGTLFKINVNNIEKCSLGTSNITIDDDILKNQNISLGEHFGPINSIVLSRAGDSDNIYKRDETLTEWNEFKISDNQLMNDNNRSDYIDELYDTLYGIEYDIFDLELVGYGGFEPLQNISIETDNKTYNSYVFNNEENYTQGYTESIYTERPEESQTDYTKSDKTDRKINQVYIIVDKQNQEIEALASKVVDISETKKGVGSIELTNASETALYKLIIKNACQIFPSQKLYPDENLYPKNSNLIIEYSDNTQKIIELPSLDLMNYEGVNDDLTIENGIATKTKRIGINENGDMYLLDTPVVTEIGKIDIPLKEGANKIYLQSFEYASLEATYLLKNDYTNVFANQAQVSSQLNITTDQILLESKSYTDTATDGDALISKINLDSTGNIKIEASKTIDMTGTDINLTSDNVTISSNNFSVDSDGKIKSTSGEIGGYTIGTTELYSEHVGTYEFKQSDLDKIRDYMMGTGNLTEEELKLYDINENGEIDAVDFIRIKKAIDSNNPTMSGKVELSSNNIYSMLRIKDNNGNNTVDIGLGSIRTTGSIVTDSFSCSNKITTNGLDSNNGDIKVGINSAGNPLIRLSSTSGTVHCVSVNQTSLLENKKNIEKFENATNILNDIDIYKYNFKLEDNKHKKHLGFVIGKNYKYSSEITATDDDGNEIGVDLYSMTSLCLQALKEQQEEINKLKKEIEVLKYEI